MIPQNVIKYLILLRSFKNIMNNASKSHKIKNG